MQYAVEFLQVPRKGQSGSLDLLLLICLVVVISFRKQVAAFSLVEVGMCLLWSPDALNLFQHFSNIQRKTGPYYKTDLIRAM